MLNSLFTLGMVRRPCRPRKFHGHEIYGMVRAIEQRREEEVISPQAEARDAFGYLDLEALDRARRADDPFPFVIVPGFLPPAACAAIGADYPAIDEPGSFPVGDLHFGSGFREFLAELEGPGFREAIERKFDVDLTGRPTMVTVRGQARLRDGRIHNDSRTKLITVLVYMNEAWEAEGGRLRLLRSPDDLEAHRLGKARTTG